MRDTICEYLEMNSITPTEAEITKIFKEMDQDNDSLVSFDELYLFAKKKIETVFLPQL